jgi:hypothetical protein
MPFELNSLTRAGFDKSEELVFTLFMKPLLHKSVSRR